MHVHRSVNRFVYSKPFKSEDPEAKNEFQTLCIERFIFTTKNTFPFTNTFSEVADTETVILQPLEVALEMVNDKNQDISRFIVDYKSPGRKA